uniref:Transposase n=1 Tax=Acrobeloides nanus TaxID=290746 RepID=A0A914CMN7_9BILA
MLTSNVIRVSGRIPLNYWRAGREKHREATQQLDRLAEAVSQKRPDKTKIILQHDNAKPHTAKLTKAKIQELEGKYAKNERAILWTMDGQRILRSRQEKI